MAPPRSWTGRARVAAAAVAAAAAASADPNATTLHKVSLHDVDPLAVCNDGTPAAYYWKPATTSPSTWIVDMQGGDWCYSAESCQSRCTPGAALCSSKGYTPAVEQDGLFRPAKDPALAGANKVWIKYCTSDGHMGDGEAFGFQFRGGRVVQAVLSDLVHRRGLGAASGRQLFVLGGQSAGARGAMVHLDYVLEMLGPTVAPQVDVVGLLDSPLWLDTEPFIKIPSLAATTRAVYKYGRVAHLGEACMEAHAGDDRWKCMMGEYRMRYVKTPYLLVASQYDSYQLNRDVGRRPTTPQEQAYAVDFAKRTAALVRSYRANWPSSATRQNAVFSWACYTHATTCTPAGFDTGTCQGTTVDEAMRQFLGLEAAPRRAPRPNQEWVDNCTGFACGPGCDDGHVVAVYA